MVISETFSQRQERQAARLRDVCRAAVTGVPVAGPSVSKVAPSSPAMAVPPASSPAAPPPVDAQIAKPGAHVHPTATQLDVIGFGWDAVVYELNRKIAAQYGSVWFHTRDAAAIFEAACAAADPLNDERLHHSAQAHTRGTSPWDDAVARVNAANGVSEPLMRNDRS